MEVPTNLMTVSGFFRFAEPLDFDAVRGAVTEGLLKFDRFRCRAEKRGWPRRPRWVQDPEFDLDNHLIRVALDDSAGDRELREQLEALIETPLDPERPLWQFHQFDNYRGGSLLFFRLHHCIADGIALASVMLAMCEQEDQSRGGAFPPSPVGNKPQRSPWRWLGLPLTGPWFILRASATTLRLLFRTSDDPSALKGEVDLAKRTSWIEPLPLAEVKARAKAAGATVNDLLLATVAGALRRYLEHRGEPVDGLDIRVLIPVNLRSPERAEELGNRFTFVFARLPVGLPEPLHRLDAVKRDMDRLKRGLEGVVVYGSLRFVALLGARPMKGFIRSSNRKLSGIVTNVPGPREPLLFAGRRIEGMMFWVPQGNPLGLGISIISYAGEVTIGVMTDRKLVPDPEVICDSISAEFATLRASLKEEPAAHAQSAG